VTNTSRESERVKNKPKNNWLQNAKVFAEEIQALRTRGDKESRADARTINIFECVDDNSEWGKKAKKYLTISTHENKTNQSLRTAAKFACCSSSPEKTLIASIELARTNYTTCSLTALSRIINTVEIDKEERLDACLTIIESITTNNFCPENTLNDNQYIQELLYAARVAKELVKIIGAIKNMYQNKSELEGLNELLNNVISISRDEKINEPNIDEKAAIEYAQTRTKMREELSKIYDKQVIRSIHHFACTGGTLISKCIATMPDVALISEINPMNRRESRFTPTNPLLQLERGHRAFSTEEIIEIFKKQIEQAIDICAKDDVDLVLRDHSHTDFCMGKKETSQCAILDHLSKDHELLSIVTVRHPLDSYLSMRERGWHNHFQPNGIHEYCRRYLKFIKKYSSIKIVKYEDFCDEPQRTMEIISRILKISYDTNFINTYGQVQLSGDSGRVNLERIERRERRVIPEEVRLEIENSEFYGQLLERLNYQESQ